jgi:hypothetical protein
VPVGAFFSSKEEGMTKEEKSRYSEPEALRDILKRVLAGRRFRLDCRATEIASVKELISALRAEYQEVVRGAEGR